MKMKRFRNAIACCAVVALTAAAPFASAEPSNKWRITFNHATDNDGEVVFRIAPLNGTPIDVSTKLPKSTGENQVAQLVKKSLKATLGKGYHVEVDDFEAVIVKKTGKTPNFDLVLEKSTISGLSIDVKRK